MEQYQMVPNKVTMMVMEQIVPIYTATKTIKALEETKKMLDEAGGYETVLNYGLESLKD
jgi:hypothetical protein